MKNKLIFLDFFRVFSVSLWLFPGFAAFRPVEDNPDDQIVAEILEAVRFACGGEEQVAGMEGLAALSKDELSAALYDDVHLVARVRLLRV